LSLVAKLTDRLFQYNDHRLNTYHLKNGLKSDQEITEKEVLTKLADALAKKSAISLP
jgi:hypothetical protein